MTGYARVCVQTDAAPLTVSVRSVNRRILEVSCHLPPFLAPFEGKIGRWSAEKVDRGHLHFNIQWPLPQKLTPNLPFLRELREAIEAVQKETDLPFNESFTLACRGQEGNLLLAEETTVTEDDLQKGVNQALDALLLMRANEGEAISADLLMRCNALEELARQVEDQLKDNAEKVRVRLTERLKKWEIGDERILQEVALYAERADVTEELVRFRHHLATLQEKLMGEERAQGKVCEFIVQEMVRETNTLGAKAQDKDASKILIEMKGEIEKIREQLANVE